MIRHPPRAPAWRRLLRIRNLLTALIVGVALVVSLEPRIGGVELEDRQIILALFAILALDMLIDRSTTLASIDETVQEVHEHLSGTLSASAVLKARRQLPRMEELIAPAARDLLVCGVNLEGVTGLTGMLRDKLRDGVAVRLLALDPDGDVLLFSSQFSDVDPSTRAEKIRNNLKHLQTSLVEWSLNQRGDCSLKVVDTFLATGCVMLDGSRRNGQIYVQHYLYHSSADVAPSVVLSRRRDRDWYTVYKSQIDTLWRSGRTYKAIAE